MLEYILKRIGQTIIVLFFVSVFAFSLIRMAPGNPALLMVPDASSKEVIAAMEEKLGLKDPLPVQYFRYITGVLRGDLGDSTQYRVPVSEIVKNRLPNTAVLALVSVLAGLCIAIPLGIFAGARRGTFADFFAMFMALLGQSLSPVWLSVLLMMIFANWFGILPAMGMDSWKNLILPVATLAYPMAAQITRVGRSGMIDTLGEDYIIATYAKGISSFEVNWKYAFKNALIPIVTLVGITMGSFLSGTVIVETVFGWTGIGQLMTQSVGVRDYAMVQSLILISASLIAIINMLVDIINSFIDPRMTLS
ncbi:MAG: ABC transporter permease [Lachnospiraceae bacterium]|jgi:peptide/nickel transport system permease protein|nr:ABC transporter permease [Lachnospiraceae bacterium]